MDELIKSKRYSTAQLSNKSRTLMVAMKYSLVLLLEMRDHLNKLKSKLEIIMEKKRMLDTCQHKYIL